LVPLFKYVRDCIQVLKEFDEDLASSDYDTDEEVEE